MEFSYSIKEGQVCVDKILDPDAAVGIPEELEGLPVMELGPYVLSGSAVEEIHIPSQVRKIGAYAFYGCEKLRRFYCYGRAADLGTGIFADDRNLSFLDITLFAGERSCLKDMLSELRQTLRVRIHERTAERQEREARLIFPEYFEESVENTPARKLAVETHGCGQRYRYCFVRREFQYDDYDALFPHIQVQEAEALAAELAIGRLKHPLGLDTHNRERYETYLREHWRTSAEILIRADRPNRADVTNMESGQLPWLVEEVVKPVREQVREMIRIAQYERDTEMVSYLMDYNRRSFAGADTEGGISRVRKRRFEL